MKNQKGVSMITLIITIIVIIILAAIAFVGMDDATGSAQFSGFASEFGDYANNFQNGPYANVTEALGLAGKASNKAQKYYAAARKVSLSEFDTVLNAITVPGGYTFNAGSPEIKDATGAAYTNDTFDVCYQIKDGVMEAYPANTKFYGDANGTESHWVTNKGLVFTLPGFPRSVDGEERMYITADLYYIPAADGTMIVGDASHMTEVDTKTSTGESLGTGDVDADDDVTVGSQRPADAIGA